MTYKILSTRQDNELLYTLVEYNFNGNILEIEVAHFNPQSTEEIENNIINRAASELQRLEKIQQLNELLPNIELNQTKDIII
jgi:hypothetical protein